MNAQRLDEDTPPYMRSLPAREPIPWPWPRRRRPWAAWRAFIQDTLYDIQMAVIVIALIILFILVCLALPAM